MPNLSFSVINSRSLLRVIVIKKLGCIGECRKVNPEGSRN